MFSLTTSAPLFLTAFLAFGPFGGCGVDHTGSRDTVNGGVPKAPPGGGGNEGGEGGGGGGGGTVVTTNVPVTGLEGPSGGTPEPATILLVSGAAAGYGALRMRRRKLEVPKQEA